MSSRRGPLVGEPSGFRVRVPLAGMPTQHGIRNSGQIPLPTWASPDQRPCEWTPPIPSFDTDPGRKRELARLMATLKMIPEVANTPCPHLHRLAEVHNQEDWTEEDVSNLWPELDLIETQAAQRTAWLQRTRSHLHAVSHGELGVRTRRREDSKGGEAGEPPSPRPAAKEPPPSIAPPPPPPPPLPVAHRYTGVVLKWQGVAPRGGLVLRPDPTDESGPAPAPISGSVHAQGTAQRATAQGTSRRESAAAVAGGGAAGAAAGVYTGGASSMPGTHGSGCGGGGGAGAASGGGGLSAAARRAQQAAQAKAAAEARQREELGEAAGYTSLRIKPNSSINPRQFWAAVDDYMRPLPKQLPPIPAPPVPLPERSSLTDRLIAALLPLPSHQCAPSASVGSVTVSTAPSVGGSATGGVVGGQLTAEQLESQLRETVVSIGLLRESETAPELRSDDLADEMRRLQAELQPLARCNAQRLELIHRRAQVRSAKEVRQRMVLTGVTKAQRRQQRQRQLQEQQQQLLRAPKKH